ncbi:hypothetical protein GUITHDRAFT_101696 [Guillardia theta CCMP2712]|uniref:PH domain-containing protein n=1 Tax=Guillardia theta (strain CCMP2712) TaxID=905079 RepID=L1JVW6_GUITC|nr:hypothetical protein GUITHDRAFT_101696 [Guillardia theta CCMP2712]EKX52527.1 hypothetical protein GUITHDRAFT_101696 [Guillardia theta CCMP2712]|eukprot:XP_005839507.1 hypothetical protein GUITHDRAFT_101696 [Guillardia theta CCMP2712]
MAQRAAIVFASVQNQEQYATQPRSSNESSNALHGILNNKDDEDSEMVFEGDVVKSGSVWKLCSGGRHDWQERTLVVTTTHLYLAKQGNKSARDVVPLHEIVNVRTALKVDQSVSLAGAKLASTLAFMSTNSDVDAANGRQSTRQSGNKGLSEDDCFWITTSEEGSNAGRTIVLRVENKEKAEEWMNFIRQASKAAASKKERETKSTLKLIRDKSARMYHSKLFQGVVASVIALNFILNIAEAQVVPTPNSYWDNFFGNMDIIFTSFLAFELLWNIAIHFFWQFVTDGWNIFDFVRLFRKLTSLRILFNAIIGSLIPVLNSVLVLVVVIVMYAILAVELYGTRAQEFSNLHESMFSMYQVATGDSWASMLARSLFYVCVQNGKEVGTPNPPGDPAGVCDVGQNEFDGKVMIFFTSYSIITGMVLLNVVVAVLLDNFTRSVAQEDQASRAIIALLITRFSELRMTISPQIVKNEKAEKQGSRMHSASEFCLDVIMDQLAAFESLEHLHDMTLALFKAVNLDEKPALSFDDLQLGLKLEHYTNRMITKALMEVDDPDSEKAVTLTALKLLLSKNSAVMAKGKRGTVLTRSNGDRRSSSGSPGHGSNQLKGEEEESHKEGEGNGIVIGNRAPLVSVKAENRIGALSPRREANEPQSDIEPSYIIF